MFNLVANTTRSHGGIEMRFVDAATTLAAASRNKNIIQSTTTTKTVSPPPPSAKQSDTKATINAAEHLDIPNRVQHWFRGGHTCRLCNAIHLNPKEHFQSGVEARHHVIKEIFLSYWMEEDRKGLPFTGTSMWEKRLASKRMDSKLCLAKEEMMRKYLKGYVLPPITSSSSTSTTTNPSYSHLIHQRKKNIEQRGLFLHCLLRFFKDINVLGASLSPALPGPSEKNSSISSSAASDPELQQRYPHRIFTKSVRNTVRFESLEYTGDSLWGFEASARLFWLMPHRDWLSTSHAWAGGILRDGVESNDNLMKLAEMIRLESLLAPGVILGGGKPFADVLEAIMGELHCRLMELNSGGAGDCRSGVGILHNLSPGHYLNGAAPKSQADEVLSTMIRFAIDEINDLATLNFGYFHVGFNAEKRLVPFARELVHSEVLMKMEPSVGGAKSQRTSNMFFKGRRLKGIFSGSSSPQNPRENTNSSSSSSSSSYSSSPPSSPGSFFDDFTFIDFKLHQTPKKVEEVVEEITKTHPDYREKDRLWNSTFSATNSTSKKSGRKPSILKMISMENNTSEKQQQQEEQDPKDSTTSMGSFYEKKIHSKSFTKAMSKFLNSYPGENRFVFENCAAADDDDDDDDDADDSDKNHQWPSSSSSSLIIQSQEKDSSKLYYHHQSDKLRVETFAFSCVPQLMNLTEVGVISHQETTTSSTKSSSSSSLSSSFSHLEFAKHHQPRAEAIYGESVDGTSSCRLSKYKPVDESRIFPVHAPFETDTGYIPQIVLETEAKRTALANKRRKMRKNRQI